MTMDEDKIILRRLMERNGERHPDREVVTFESGERWAARQALEEGRAAAHVLREQGVGPGDVVGVFLPNGPAYLRAWWGVHFLGAALAPFNLALKGGLLSHLLKLAKPRLCITEHEWGVELSGVDPDLPILAPERLATGDRSFVSQHTPTIADAHVLMATSGTTGPSKLWRVATLQQAQLATYVQLSGLGEGDRFLLDLPLFHAHAMGIVRSCQESGVPISLRSKPSLSRYFEIMRETGATAASLIGTMAAKLAADPPSADDRNHKLKFVLAAPLPPNADQFCERFGIRTIITSLGSTELSGILVSDPNEPPIPGSCGRAREGYDFRLVDGDDNDVPPGEIGELLVRPHHPVLRSGYVDNQEATEEAWRGGWFHTGDLLRVDAFGNYYFVDRLKDSLRRRGENISSYEVEAEVRAFPGVRDVACVAARSDEGAGDEVKVWVVAEDAGVDFRELARFLFDRVPRYMVPRYYELVDALPVTATNKVQKHHLRARGNGPMTFDLERASATKDSAPAQSAAATS